MIEAVLPRAHMLRVIDMASYTRPFTAVARGAAYPDTRVVRMLRFKISATGGSEPPQPI